MKKVIFETVGPGNYLDDYRCGGSKPWGGGEVTYRAELSAKDIVTALERTEHGRAALLDFAKRNAQHSMEQMAQAGCRMTDRELLELAAKAAGIEYDAEQSKPTKSCIGAYRPRVGQAWRRR